MPDDLAEIYRSTFPALVRFLYRKVWDVERAEDLAQEAFARAVVHKPESARGWLFVVAANMARDDARRAARERRHLTLLKSDPASAPAVDEAVHAGTERSRVRTALEQLTPRDREVLLLWDAGLSYDEIATQTGLARGAVGATLAQPPPPVRWPARQPLAWAASVVLALAAGWYLRGESPSAPVRPDRRAAAANAAAPRETARTVPPSPRQTPETKTLAQQAPSAAQHDQMISGSAVPNPQITPLDQAARAKAATPAPAPAAALAAPAAPLAARWETIPWDTARAMLGVEPVRIPNLPAVAKRSSAADRVVLVEQQLASGAVVRLQERPAAEGAPGMEVGAVAVQRLDGSERLARYVGNLRVEIEGALPADSLSKLLELVK